MPSRTERLRRRGGQHLLDVLARRLPGQDGLHPGMRHFPVAAAPPQLEHRVHAVAELVLAEVLGVHNPVRVQSGQQRLVVDGLAGIEIDGQMERVQPVGEGLHAFAQLHALADVPHALHARRAPGLDRGPDRARAHDGLHVFHQRGEVVVEQVNHAHVGLDAPQRDLGAHDHPELAETAAHDVEQLAVPLARAGDDLAGAGDHLQLEHVVGLRAVAEAGDAEPRHRQGAADRDPQVVGEHPRQQPVRERRVDQVAPDHAAADRGRLAGNVDLVDDRHRGGVEEHAARGGRLTALGVGLALRHDRDALVAAAADHLGDLLGRSAARDGARQAVHHAAEVGAEVRAHLLVQQDPLAQRLPDLAQRLGGRNRTLTLYGHRGLPGANSRAELRGRDPF